MNNSGAIELIWISEYNLFEEKYGNGGKFRGWQLSRNIGGIL
jgi:hypothetical protein